MCWTCTNPRKPTSCAACCISSCCAYLFTPTMTCRAEGGRLLGGEGGMSIARIIHIHERPLPAGPAGPAKLAMLKLCVLAAPAYCCQPPHAALPSTRPTLPTCLPLSMCACCRAAHSSIFSLGRPAGWRGSSQLTNPMLQQRAAWHTIARLRSRYLPSLICRTRSSTPTSQTN